MLCWNYKSKGQFIKHRTIFGSTSYNAMSRFIEEIPEEYVEGLKEIQNTEESSYDSPYSWEYGKAKVGVSSYKMNPEKAGQVKKEVEKTYNFRTPESFLSSLGAKATSKEVDLSQYEAGKRVYHKKFGEGTINYVEQEGDDLKVDITFDKVGHKRLMAKFAGLEII